MAGGFVFYSAAKSRWVSGRSGRQPDRAAVNAGSQSEYFRFMIYRSNT